MGAVLSAEAIIRELGLEPHPEGGFYHQTFRDKAGGERGHSTAIYYLLEKGVRSHWHRVTDAVEVWHYYAGAPIALHLSDDGREVQTFTLGPAICLLYTSDAADDMQCVDLGGRRIIKKKKRA